MICPDCRERPGEDPHDGLCATCAASEADVDSSLRRLLITPMSSVEPEKQRWLWDRRIPLGAVTLLVGREKLGKSTLTIELAARLSRGELDGDLAGQKLSTLIVSYEDTNNTIAMRAIAANADTRRLHRVSALASGVQDLVSLPADVEGIGQLARQHEARLVIIDPLSASLGGDVNAHRDQDMRRALAPLAQLAEDQDLAVVVLAHWNKTAGGDSLSRVMGSRGLTAAVRSVLAFGRPPDVEDGSHERVLAHPACNVGQEQPSLTCRVEGCEIDDRNGEVIPTSRLVILGETDTNADDLLVTRSSDDVSERDQAADWLVDELADGEAHPTRELIGRAKEAGIARATLYRAADRLGIEKGNTGEFPKRATWRLSDTRLTAVSAPLETAEIAGGETAAKTLINTGDSAGQPSQLSQLHIEETTGTTKGLLKPDDPEVVFDIAQAALAFGSSEDELAEQIERARRLA